MRFAPWVCLMLLTGCRATVHFTPDQLWAVAGLPATGKRTLYTDHGFFDFDGTLPVQVVALGQGALPPAPLFAMRHQGDALVIHPPGGQAVDLPRQSLGGGDASTFSGSRALGLAAAAAFGLSFVYICCVGLALLPAL